MAKLLKYPHLAYLWCMERVMWYRFRRAWAYAMTHPHDPEAFADFAAASADYDRVSQKISEVRNG